MLANARQYPLGAPCPWKKISFLFLETGQSPFSKLPSTHDMTLRLPNKLQETTMQVRQSCTLIHREILITKHFRHLKYMCWWLLLCKISDQIESLG